MKSFIYASFIVTFLCVASSCGKKTQTKNKYVAKVKAAYAKKERIPFAIEGIGHFVAYNSAEIKAQVEGRLMNVHFCEGQHVQEGDLLLTIDPRPYEAQLEKAIAEKTQTAAKLQYAAEKVARFQTLLPENYVSPLEYIKFQSEMQDYEGGVMQKEAEIRLAQINLDYCFIKAPFSGITSKRLVDKGNLVTNDGSALLTIKQINPILIDFSLPERDFLKIAHYFRKRHLNVEIEFPEHEKITFTADLSLIGNEIDKKTGMIPLRAKMTNNEGIFWPGQFVRANLIVTHINDAVMVPETCVQIGQKGQYVYVINHEKKAEIRYVTTGEQQGEFIQITKGVKEDELCVTSGQLGVRPGIHVEVVEECAS